MIIYLYSMESFIYADLNKACRNKDTKKIRYYGAFSAALSFIIDNANRKLNKTAPNKSKNMLYRGIKLTPDEANGYIVGNKTHLTGYTSTSRFLGVALGFAFMEQSEYSIPVVLEIDFQKDTGFFELTEEFTAYPEEAEVLVQDGLEYLVVSNTEQEESETKQKYRLI